jgi:hypothetical protein
LSRKIYRQKNLATGPDLVEQNLVLGGEKKILAREPRFSRSQYGGRLRQVYRSIQARMLFQANAICHRSRWPTAIRVRTGQSARLCAPYGVSVESGKVSR